MHTWYSHDIKVMRLITLLSTAFWTNFRETRFHFASLRLYQQRNLVSHLRARVSCRALSELQCNSPLLMLRAPSILPCQKILSRSCCLCSTNLQLQLCLTSFSATMVLAYSPAGATLHGDRPITEYYTVPPDMKVKQRKINPVFVGHDRHIALPLLITLYHFMWLMSDAAAIFTILVTVNRIGRSPNARLHKQGTRVYTVPDRSPLTSRWPRDACA